MAFGELLAVGTVQQRQVGVAGRVDPERREDEQLLGRVRQVVVAADDLGDPHVGVVDRDREVVDRGAVGARDHEVVLEAILERDRAANHIVDHGLPLVGGAEANRRPLPGPRLAAVSGATVVGLPGAHLLGGRRVGIGASGVDQLGDSLAMGIGSLGLAQRPLVPVELEPAQRVEDLLDVLGGRALAVGVLDPQHQRSAGPARREPVIECGPRPADVQGPGGRRCESDSRGGAHQLLIGAHVSTAGRSSSRTWPSDPGFASHRAGEFLDGGAPMRHDVAGWRMLDPDPST